MVFAVTAFRWQYRGMSSSHISQSVSSEELYARRLWAMGMLFFLTISSELLFPLESISLHGFLAWMLFITITIVLHAPQLPAFPIMLVTQIVYALSTLPNLQNHRYVCMFANIALLSCYDGKAYFNASARWATARLLIVVYFFAAFHKLNLGFLDLTTSCAAKFEDNIRLVYPFFPKTGLLGIYGTLALELAFALLLCSKRAWRFTALIAVLFHVVLSFDYIKTFINFSGVMIALLTVTFASPQKTPLFHHPKYLKFLPLLLAASVYAQVFIGEPPLLHITLVHIALLTFAFGCIVALYESLDFPSMTSSFAARIVLLLVLLNAASPYLGIKNRGAFNMYSNLQITHESSNHLIIPKSFDLLHFQSRTPEGFLGVLFPRESDNGIPNNQCVW